MQHITIILRRLLIITLFPCIVSRTVGSEKPDIMEQTIESIRDSMEQSPVPWPEKWKEEYIEIIRKVVELHRDIARYPTRLEILSKGFEPYWESFDKISERSFFELHCARIRWYTENLMGSTFPSEVEKQKLRDQYIEIWDYAADSLLKQFPFLDPNAVLSAKEDDLIICFNKIDMPLIPVYLRPMSEEQVAQIKQLWDKLCYKRIDLLRQRNQDSSIRDESHNASSANKKLDYELTKYSLSQLLGLVWMVVPERPDYYLNAIDNRNKALKENFQSKSNARAIQQLLEKERSRQLLQTEHISFLLTTLLETMSCIEGSDSIRPIDQISLEQQDK